MASGRLFSVALALVACTGTITAPPPNGGNLPGDDEMVGVSGMRLLIDEPARGAMIPTSAGPIVRVAGRVLGPEEGETLTIQGQPVNLAFDGTFAADLNAQKGVTIIVAELAGVNGVAARAQRSFIYGDFAPPEEVVRSAVALRVNRDGFDDNDGELDDLASLVEESLAARDLIGTLPGSYQFDASVVGTVDVVLLDRQAGRPQVELVPQSGGVRAEIRIENVRIRHQVTFDCLLTTCTSTGTTIADAVVVTGEMQMTLAGGTINASTRNPTIDIVGFRNEEDGAVGSLLQSVLEYFTGDLETRIESMLQPAVEQAARADFAVAVSALQVPEVLDLAPLDARLELAQEFDALEFSDSGAVVALGVRARGQFLPDEPGLAAPGWLKWGGTLGDYRLQPSFAASSALDLFNQTLFATWGQNGLVYDIPAGQVNLGSSAIGAVHVTVAAPPVVFPGDAEGSALRVIAGDVLLDTTIDGEPLKIYCSIVGNVALAVDLDGDVLSIALADQPVIYAEMIEGPENLSGGFFTSIVEQLGPESLTNLVQSVRLPLPVIPLDGVADTMRGKVLKLAPPAEVANEIPSARITLYGRFLAR